MVITTYKAYFVINFKSYPPFTPSPSKKKSQLRKFGLEIVKKKKKKLGNVFIDRNFQDLTNSAKVY